MKILHLSESRGWSGGASQLLALASGLRRLGCGSFLACPPEGELRRRAEAEGIETFAFEPFQDYDVFAARAAARLARDLSVDVLHAHHPRAHAVALMAKLMAGRPRPRLVVTRRVTFPVGRNPLSALKYRSGAVDGYIAVAETVRERLAEGGVDPRRVAVIPSGVDLSSFSPRPPDPAFLREQGLGGSAPVVGLVGHYGSWKGHEVFLRAAGELKRRGVSAVFVVAGRGTEDPELAEEARRAGLESGDFRLLGFRQDVPRILSCLAVSVNAATGGEGISGALRESLAMGIPVAASRVGGNAELVQSGRTGETFPAGDWRALADAVEALLGDRERARSLAEAGRRFVEENLTVETMVERTFEFYARVTGRIAAAAG